MKLTIPRRTLDEVRKGMSQIVSSGTVGITDRHIRIGSEPGKVNALGTDGESALSFSSSLEENTDGAGTCLLPVKEMSTIPGKARDIILITAEDEKKVTAEVLVNGATERVHFNVPAVSNFPETDIPDHLKFRTQSEDAGELIRHALRCTDAAPTRYTLNYLALEKDRVVATNGRKLFAVNSFAFPWRSKQPKLVPESKVFGCRSVLESGELSVAYHDNMVYFRFGERWTLKLPIVEGNFPDWEPVVPKKAKCRIEFGEEAANRVIVELPGLPGADDPNAPVRLHVDGKVRFAAWDEDKEQETLDLEDVQVTGRKTEIGFNRTFLIEGLKMGFREFRIAGPSDPIVTQDDRKLFLFMPLGQAEEKETNPTPGKETKKMNAAKEPRTQTTNQTMGIEEILNRLAALKEQTKQLVGSVTVVQKELKTYSRDLRKREKLVKSTLSSLKNLKAIGL